MIVNRQNTELDWTAIQRMLQTSSEQVKLIPLILK